MTEVLSRTQAAKETAKRFLRLDSAHLKLGVMCTIGPVRFVSFLSRFRADNPGIEITLTEAVPDRLCDLLSKGELDVALIARPGGFPAPLVAVIEYWYEYLKCVWLLSSRRHVAWTMDGAGPPSPCNVRRTALSGWNRDAPRSRQPCG